MAPPAPHPRSRSPLAATAPAARRARRSAALAVTALVAAVTLPGSASASAAPATSTTAPARAARHQLPPAPAATPYMGWSSWSLESTNYPGVNATGPASWLTEAHVLQQADVVAAKLKSHGYEYVNVDAGWSNGFDGYGRPIANPATFPDGLAYLADHVHAEGLKLGTYLAVGLDPKAYGTGDTPIHGTSDCHTRDIVYPDLRTTNGWNSAYKIDYSNPCAQAYIDSVADEFAGWGVDYLKLDGVGPGSNQGDANHDDTPDVAAWSKALRQTGRPIQFTISWSLSHKKAGVWKADTNGWRVDTDVECYCDTLVTWNNSVKERWNDVVQWIPDAGPGHWNNLDSLDVGNGAMDGITDDERRSYATFWAVEAAPLYSGDDLTRLDDYGLKLLTNDEVIGVDQAGTPAKPVSQATGRQVWYTHNADGSYTVALFNLGDAPATVTARWSDLGINGPANVRDLWSHRELGASEGDFHATLPVHGSRLLRITPHGDAATPWVPTAAHATASTATSVSLSWDPSASRTAPATRYDVYSGPAKVASVTGTSATVQGLAPATGYSFTVVAEDAHGRRSAPSEAVAMTTADGTGPIGYEAEAPGNTVSGGAGIGGCGGCSGGGKVGDLGGTGTLTFTDVTAPRAGTYLMTIAYVDGDSSRTAVVTVNGEPFDLPLAGTNDNDWDTPQTTTVPVTLRAGANTVEFGNPTDYVSDIDKITV